ncbi:unnamed protein product, partial [Pleuronectes platessa]
MIYRILRSISHPHFVLSTGNLICAAPIDHNSTKPCHCNPLKPCAMFLSSGMLFLYPGCVSSVNGSAKWLQANIGGFSEFAALHDLLGLNPISPVPNPCRSSLPTQVAQLPLTSGASNDTRPNRPVCLSDLRRAMLWTTWLNSSQKLTAEKRASYPGSRQRGFEEWTIVGSVQKLTYPPMKPASA